MKRIAAGALFFTLVTGSVAALAGNGYAASQQGQHREQGNHRGNGDNNRNDHRGQNDHSRGGDNRSHDNGHRFEGRNDHRNDGRGNGRNGVDGRNHYNGRNDHRNDGRGNGRNDFDGRNHYNGRNDHNNGRFDGRNRYDNRYGFRGDSRHYDPRFDHGRGYNNYARPRYHYGVYHRPYGYYDRSWHRGDRLPRAYYGRPYVIAHYGSYGLRRPPYGYHWVRVNSDAVLAVIATGVVLDVVFNQFY